MTYGGFSAGEHNDCNARDAPPGVVSLTFDATQTDGTGLITLCAERPDLLATSQALGPDMTGSPVHVVDFRGTAGTCTFAVDRTVAPTGTAKTEGLCANGTDSRGFALDLNGSITFTRTCGSTVDQVKLTLGGQTAVVPMP
jgi:hypothetical protein